MTTKIPVELSSTPGIVDGSNATAITIDSSENVGIGDTNPSAKLDVNSGTTNTMAHFHSTDDNGFIELKDDDTTGYIGVQNDYVYIGGAASLNTQNLVINDGTGKVGIGTTSPSSPLDIASSSSTTFVRSFGANASFEPTQTLTVHNTNGSDGSGANNSATLGFEVASGATSQGFINYVRSGDNAGFFSFSHRTESSKYREMMSMDASGMRLSGGDYSGIQSFFINNGSFALADATALNCGGVNPGALICVSAVKSNVGNTFPTALFFATDDGIIEIADPSGKFTTTVNTANSINVYMSSANFIVQNNVGNANTMSVSFMHFQGV